MLGETTSAWISDRRASARRKILDAAWDVAREQGLAALTLREVADRVGIKAPSLYSHFASKHAIYDAMFGASWTEFLERSRTVPLPSSPRAALRTIARTFFDFATEDLARHQLMNVKTIPNFEPSPQAYAASLEAYLAMPSYLPISDQADIDVYTALISGLIAQQLANDPGGQRWRRLIPRVMSMFADDLGLPPNPQSAPESS